MSSKLHLKVVWVIEIQINSSLYYKTPFRTDNWCLFLNKKDAVKQLKKEIKNGYLARLVRYERGKVFKLGKLK